ncbi:MAG TPA: N-acetyl-gamma-glutamyl-phosphate reductase [Bacteroidia bacterium]|nr:N-acetyl-gamma-glutamyl-phosphate reductase [Bacteroidia bacterium]
MWIIWIIFAAEMKKNCLQRKFFYVMKISVNKTILIAITTLGIGNATLRAQSTTNSNDYTPASYLGWGDNSSDLLFKVNNNTRMVLQNTTGNLGLGTLTPTSQFHVTGNPGTAPIAHFQTNTGFSGLMVKSNGKVAVGSDYGSAAQFDVRGEALPNTYENLFMFTVTDAAVVRRPIFVPSVGNFRQGMLVQLPLHLNTLPGKPTPADLESVLQRHYQGSEWVTVEPATEDGKLEPTALNDTNKMELRVYHNMDYAHAVLIARLDNLGKGASGAAVQNLRLMLGL